MTKPNQLSAHKLSLAICILLGLGGCGPSTNNFPTPPSSDGKSGVALRPCKDKCLKIDVAFEPVKNLNYSCGETIDVTTTSSGAKCPVNTTMKLYIQGKNKGKRIDFGERYLPQFGIGSKNLSAYFLRLNPLDFTAEKTKATSAKKAPPTEANTTKALNIIRFLDAFRVMKKTTTDGKTVKDANGNPLYERVRYNHFAPTNHLTIPDEMKATMDEHLTDNVTLEDFGSDAFIQKTKAWLAHHGLKVELTENFAKPRLKLMQETSMSTLYQSFPNVVTTGLQGTATDGKIDSKYVQMQQYVLINRENKPIGQGVFWRLDKTADAQDYVTIRQKNRFSPMRFLSTATPKINPFTNQLTDYRWQVAGGDNQTSPVIDFYQGTLLRDFGIFGSEFLYAQNTGEDLKDKTLLGRWRTSGSFGESGNGKFTLMRINNARQETSLFLDPQVWVSQHGVKKGERYVFPLHLTLDFTYGNTSQECGSVGCRFNKGKLGITILENGNIITDGSREQAPEFVNGKPDCEAEDSTELAIGVVRASSQNTYDGVPGMFINPGIMLSGERFGELDGVQIGTRVLDGKRIVFNIKQLIDSAALGKSTPGNVNANAEQGKTLAPATWANAYNILLSQYVLAQKSAGNTQNYSAEEEERATKKQKGRFTITPSSCYTLAQSS